MLSVLWAVISLLVLVVVIWWLGWK